MQLADEPRATTIQRLEGRSPEQPMKIYSTTPHLEDRSMLTLLEPRTSQHAQPRKPEHERATRDHWRRTTERGGMNTSRAVLMQRRAPTAPEQTLPNATAHRLGHAKRSPTSEQTSQREKTTGASEDSMEPPTSAGRHRECTDQRFHPAKNPRAHSTRRARPTRGGVPKMKESVPSRELRSR